MILIEIYQTNVKMMMFLIEIYQPDYHEHKRLQPLEVATLEAALLCPKAKQLDFLPKINNKRELSS